MSRPLAFALAASSALNMVYVVVGRGSFGHFLAIIPMLGIALILLCLGPLIRIAGGPAPDVRRLAKRVMGLGLVAGSCLISLPIGGLVNLYDIEQARGYCDRLRPALERHRIATGRYPEHLSDVLPAGQVPRLLHGVEFYFSGKDYYVFTFCDPAGMLNGLEFVSSRQAWRHWD